MPKKTIKSAEPKVEETKVETPEVKIPFTKKFEYFNLNGQHKIIKEGKVLGSELSEEVARSKADRFNHY